MYIKRVLLQIICVLFFFTTLSGCAQSTDQSGKEVTVTVLMDVSGANAQIKASSGDFQSVISHYYDNIKIEVQTLSVEYTERQTQLTNIRAEIMSGGGPDIFILPTWNLSHLYDEAGNDKGRNEPLFTDVENAMRNRLFLPLNEYIDESDHYQPEQHIQTIMRAGIIDGEQLVMPLLYSFDVFLMDKKYFPHKGSHIVDYKEIIDNPFAEVASLYPLWAHSALGKYVDYDNEEILISEEELVRFLEYTCEVTDNVKVNDYSSYINTGLLDDNLLSDLNMSEGEFVPLVIPNCNQGITASITAFAAVNANTNHPQEAFNVVELFFSKEWQRREKIWMDESQVYGRLPFTEPAEIGASCGIQTGLINYTEERYPYCWSDISVVNDRINAVKFVSETDCRLYDACESIKMKKWEGETIDYAAIAAELYSDWKMMVAE